MLVRRQLLKVKKQFADQTFLRGDKLDNQSDLDIAQKRVDAIKHSCQTLQKKINACLQGSGQDASAIEKRKKKMPAFLLAHSMHEGGSMCEEGSILGIILRKCSPVQNHLAEELLNFENQVENNVLSPLNVLIETDIPNIVKMRKQLNKLIQDMESARSKFENAAKHTNQGSYAATGAAINKAESIKEEYEELSMKVEQQRDMLAAEMFSLLSRETEIARIFVQWYQLQADYHSNVSSILEMDIPQMSNIIDNHTHRPAYGCPITEHLRVTNRQISLVIEKCISALLVYGMNEEGLFRIGGSASKLKKLKNSFDAGIINMTEYVTDPHSIAGALKSYLRELPEPLLTHILYDEWMNANTISDHDLRLQTFWQIVNKLPEANFNNLKYIIKFLAKLTTNSEINKMSTQNLAIVMAPNLIWPPQADQSNHIGMNMTVANIHSSIVDSLVTYADYFFPGEVDFTISPLPLSNDNISDAYMGIVNSGFVASNGEVESESVPGSFNTSPTSQSPRIIHRPGKKPAPPAPGAIQQIEMKQGKISYAKPHSSPEDFSNVPLRSKSRERSRGPSLERTRSIQESEYSGTLHTNRLTIAGEKFNPSLSRSATLDRPGKPKRNSLTQRPSHDNLANFIKADHSIDTDEKPVPMVRNSSLERSRIIEKPPIHAKSMANISQIDSHGNMPIQKPILIEKGSGGKPEVPAKPPSLDNIVGSYHNSGSKSIDIDDIDVKVSEQGNTSRRSSDKDSIHFADESDNEEVFKMDSSIHSVATPLSSSMDSSKEEIDRSNQSPSQLQTMNAPSPPTNAASLDPTMSSFSAKMEKKWAFLTSQTPNTPPERPPRNFPLPGSQMKEEYISAPIPGSFVHVSSHMTQSSENILSSSDLSINKMTASTLSLPGTNTKCSGENQSTSVMEDTSSLYPLLDDTNKEKGHETETHLLPMEISNANTVVSNVSAALPQNGKVPPSPTGTLKRPPRPQPPPPPIKPKLNNHSEDTRL